MGEIDQPWQSSTGLYERYIEELEGRKQRKGPIAGSLPVQEYAILDCLHSTFRTSRHDCLKDSPPQPWRRHSVHDRKETTTVSPTSQHSVKIRVSPAMERSGCSIMMASLPAPHFPQSRKFLSPLQTEMVPKGTVFVCSSEFRYQTPKACLRHI